VIDRIATTLAVALLLGAMSISPASDSIVSGQAPPNPQAPSTGKALFCAYGGVGVNPSSPPPEYGRHFAVAVVEIDSSREISDVVVSDFALYDREGKPTKFNRLVQVEEFNRPRITTEGSFAHYLNAGSTHPWNGTLRSGTMRLRVRVALAGEPGAPVRFQLALGSLVIEGLVNGRWPT
jgi:hypothetical protein